MGDFLGLDTFVNNTSSYITAIGAAGIASGIAIVGGCALGVALTIFSCLP